VEQAATVAAQDNMELACAFIQKTAIEKAIPEIDKRLVTVSLLHFTLLSSDYHLKGGKFLVTKLGNRVFMVLCHSCCSCTLKSPFIWITKDVNAV
jgi:hypothetical protein